MTDCASSGMSCQCCFQIAARLTSISITGLASLPESPLNCETLSRLVCSLPWMRSIAPSRTFSCNDISMRPSAKTQDSELRPLAVVIVRSL